MGTIVVGVDGSDESVLALRWALEEARIRDHDIDVVSVWRTPVYTGPSFDLNVSDLEAYEKAAARVAEHAIEEARTGGEGQPAMNAVVLHGHPGRCLLDHAEAKDMVVVGSRGLGGFSGLLLGSVSTYLVHHSKCPVVVVRYEEGEGEG
ncbi:MAG: Universal stress protein [Acidimicrobiales bacterium]|nr:MAG: universal stress protein [Actinomycetota bacterium]MBV6509876.1 Universal stress protein [Acidimicrobiales bacterium]RIK06187.1 MAG: universal stress protein [Acidobacteriota bacterium]